MWGLTKSEGNELEVLAVLLKRYERNNSTLTHLDPVEAIKFCMEQQGLKRKDLTPYLGPLSKVSEVLSGKRSLSLNMIRKLCKGLDIPADMLIGGSEYSASDVANTDAQDWQHFPIREMFKRDYLE